MLSGHPLESLTLFFRCSAQPEELFALFREVAETMNLRSEPLNFRSLARKGLPDQHQPELAGVDSWEAEGARIEFRLTTRASELRQGYLYELSYSLTLDRGVRLVIDSLSPEPAPLEIVARLNYVWPKNFDEIRELFRRHLGPGNDATDHSWPAVINAQAALEAGYGAFARHLIDLAEDRHRSEPSIGQEEGEWWPRLEELSQHLPKEGPKEPE